MQFDEQDDNKRLRSELDDFYIGSMRKTEAEADTSRLDGMAATPAASTIGMRSPEIAQLASHFAGV